MPTDAQSLLKSLKQRATALSKLIHQRDSLLSRVAVVERKIEKMGGNGQMRTTSAGRRSTSRPRNKVKLADAMAKVMSKDRAMKAAQISAAVKKAGYKTSSKTFQTIIYQTLAKDKRFAKAGRGQYKLKAT